MGWDDNLGVWTRPAANRETVNTRIEQHLATEVCYVPWISVAWGMRVLFQVSTPLPCSHPHLPPALHTILLFCVPDLERTPFNNSSSSPHWLLSLIAFPACITHCVLLFCLFGFLILTTPFCTFAVFCFYFTFDPSWFLVYVFTRPFRKPLIRPVYMWLYWCVRSDCHLVLWACLDPVYWVRSVVLKLGSIEP